MRHVLPLVSSLVLLAGCSGASVPSAPPAPQPPAPGAAAYAAGDVAATPIGHYQLRVDGETATVEPGRRVQAPLGQLFNVDVSEALTSTFCNTCLEVTGIRRDGDLVEIGMQVRHPFQLADNALPPSAANRRDLWISTVKGILLVDGASSFLAGEVTLDPSTLMNADGYTALLAPRGGLTANVFPYKVFGADGANLTSGNFDPVNGWEAAPDTPTGYGILANGQTGAALYRLTLDPGQAVNMELVLTAAYSVSATNRPERLAPRYFMPAGTPPEPWKAWVEVAGDLDPADPGSQALLAFKALDWQHDPLLQVDPAFPDPANRDGLVTESRIVEVEYSLPEITGEEVTPVPLGAAIGRGLASDPFQVHAALTNTANAGPGVYVGVAKFTDSRDPSGGTPLGPVTFIGPDLATPYTPPTEFATYAVFTVTVADTASCVDFTVVRSSGLSNYNAFDTPYYVQTRSEAETTGALALFEDPVQPMPPVDYTRQTVIIASTGAFIGTEGLRQVAIKDICPNQLNGLTVTIRRGDPLGGCDGGNTVVAPYVVAIMDSINPEVSFAEEQFDTCPPGECLDVVWNEVAYGDAALNGYTGPAFTLVARNQNEYEDLAGPLLGNEPLPPVDFVTQRVLVMTSGLANDELGFRFLLPTEVCLMDGRPARVTYETGEYLSCTSSDIDATAPFSLVVVDDTSASIELAAFVKLEFDICGPPSPCDDPVPYEILVQADVHDLGEGTALFQMIRNTEDLTRVWSQYFPWLQRPTIDFAEKDLFFFAFGPTYGDESRFRLDGICYDALNDQVFAHYTGFYPMSCPPPGEDAPIGQLVNVVVTDKLPPEASPFFLGNYEDLCEIPDCGGPPPVEIIEEGDGGMVWGAPGLDAVIDNQDMYERLWEVFHPSANPPAVDFSQFNVIFSIMDFREEGGGGMYRNEIVTVCSTPEDGPNVQLLQYGPDPGCPPAPPVPSAPYVFATSAKITSPNVAWHRFNRTAVPYCE